MKRYIFIVFFALILFFAPRVNAETFTGRASVGRGAVMDTSNIYTYTDYKLLSDDSINALPINAFTSATDFYIMGAEYSFPISLTGQTNFAVTVRVPVSNNTIYNYTLMDGLTQSDFKTGISPNFSVYNITPTITSFGKVQGVYSRNGVAHTYIYYDVVYNFVLDQPLTGSYNLNFAMLNTTGQRSTYYYYGGSPGTTFEFPVAFNTGNTTPDAVLFTTMSPTVSMSTGSTANNQDIIDANNENTELIINNQNENTEALQETIEQSYENLVKSQEVCTTINLSTATFTNSTLNANGSLRDENNMNVTDYINITGFTISRILDSSSSLRDVCFYNINKTFISCHLQSDTTLNTPYIIPTDAVYARFAVRSNNTPIFSVCRNGNQALYDDLHDSSFDQHSANSFFESMDFFEDATLSSVITAPLDFINSLDNGCSPIVLTYRGQSITLPCGDTIFWDREDVSTFRAFWNALFGGLIIYRLVRKLFIVVEQAMNPEDTNTLGGLDL